MLHARSGDRAVLKITPHRVDRTYADEAHQLRLLRQVGLPAPEVYRCHVGTLDQPFSYLLLEFREGVDLGRAKAQASPEAFEALQDCYTRAGKVTRAEEGAADARFHLAIAEASHNAVLLHTIRGLFDLLKRNVVTNIGGMYAQREETRDMLIGQHRALYEAIIEGRAEDARDLSNQHIDYVQEVLSEVQLEAQRVARAQRRQGL